MNKVCLYLAVMSFLLVSVSAQALVTRSEDFSTDPTAPAGTWTKSAFQWEDIQWRGTPDFDAGGQVQNGDSKEETFDVRQFYADTDLGGTFDLSEDMQFSTDFKVTDTGEVNSATNNRYRDAKAFIGFFDSTDNTMTNNRYGGAFLGIEIAAVTSTNGALNKVTGMIRDSASTLSTDLTGGISSVEIKNGRSGDQYTYYIDMSWSASARQLAWTITSNDPGFTTTNNAFQINDAQLALIGSFNSFGLGTSQRAGGDFRESWMKLYIDNAEYSAVTIPEPMTMLLLGSGAMMTLLRRKRS